MREQDKKKVPVPSAPSVDPLKRRIDRNGADNVAELTEKQCALHRYFSGSSRFFLSAPVPECLYFGGGGVALSLVGGTIPLIRR